MHPRKKKALSRQQPTNPRQLIPLIIIYEITRNLLDREILGLGDYMWQQNDSFVRKKDKQ